MLCALSVQVVEEEEDEQVLSWVGCFVWLASVTVLISILSDYIMDAITGQLRSSRGLCAAMSAKHSAASPCPHTVILLQLSS